MISDHDTEPSAYRVGLWQRAQALGGPVRARAGAGTSLSASDVEDLWADLLATAAGAVGTPGAMPADAEMWSDAQLAGWLKAALSRDIIDERRKRTNGDGEAWVAGTPLEDLAAELETRSIYTSLRSATPEEVVLQRAGVRQRTDDLTEFLGVEAARLAIAEAAGASGAEQRELLQLSEGRRRGIQNRIAYASAELRARVHAVLVLLPEAWMRWIRGIADAVSPPVAALLSAGTVAKVGAGTLAAVTVGLGSVEVVKRSEPARPPAAASSAAPRVATPLATVAAVTEQATERVGVRVRADAATQARREAAAQRRARLERERRARERAAEERRRRERAAATQPAPTPTPSSAQQTLAPATAATAPTPSGASGTAAATEFTPDGR